MHWNVWDSGAQRFVYRRAVTEEQARRKAEKMNETRRQFWLDVDTINPGVAAQFGHAPICVVRLGGRLGRIRSAAKESYATFAERIPTNWVSPSELKRQTGD